MGLCYANAGRNSLPETSLFAGYHEQTEIHALPNDKLVLHNAGLKKRGSLEIRAVEITKNNAGDAPTLPVLLGQAPGEEDIVRLQLMALITGTIAQNETLRACKHLGRTIWITVEQLTPISVSMLSVPHTKRNFTHSLPTTR